MARFVLKSIVLTIISIVVLAALFVGFYLLCKHVNWLPDFVDTISEFFEKLDIKWLNKLVSLR